ncbi:hypothetical protein TNCV_4736941 [Trichonephila clavipes]|nr:hypothetical protein TNCV_4736941 [Trichonephila clavipes]
MTSQRKNIAYVPFRFLRKKEGARSTANMPKNSKTQLESTGIHRVQFIRAVGRHPSRHGRIASRPHQQPGQACGGISEEIMSGV